MPRTVAEQVAESSDHKPGRLRLQCGAVRAVVIEDGQVTVGERPDPAPGPGELLVDVCAAGLNGADLIQRAGLYPPPPGIPADIPGLELAGRVIGLGEGCQRYGIGDRVMSIVGGAGQAELALVPEATAMPVPDSLSWEEAGGCPEAFTTAHDALLTQGGLKAGDRLLVTGGAGGVGLAGLQIGVLTGAQVTASVHRPELRARVAAFGATAVDPAEVADHGPYDVVLELVGAPNLSTDLRALATGGRIVVIGVGQGSRTEIDLLQIMAKRAVLRGSTLRARPLHDKAAAAALVERDVVPALAAGSARVPVDQVFPLDEVQAAYERFATGGKLGKIVLATGSAVAGETGT
jgi:NADPH:quinone reductase-like Zn-dependent oxidoreductase